MSRRIMLVENTTPERSSHRAALADHYDIVDAVDCATALMLLRQSTPDVECVLLSLSLEGAFDFLAAKRANLSLQMTPLLALANPAAPGDDLRALSLDATDVAVTAIPTELLLQRVRNLIRLNENASLRRALERDPLTGIFNRPTFVKRTAKMVRKKQAEIFQLQVWDVEHFKVINDLYGLATGDRVLRAIAKNLDEQIRGVGTYARLESDRFALCYPARLFQPGELLESANEKLEEMNIGIRIVLYAGVYNIDDVALNVDQMCDRAYMALKTVKGNYHERFALYDSAMREQLMLEQRINSEMNAALLQGQFCFYLQPLYSITTGEPNSAEALVRWIHPTRGVVPPKDFIPLFERNGFITKLDTYLWESVCKFLHDLIAQGITPLPISVNVSRLNLLNPTLCQDIIDTVARYELEPRLLKLEITESAYTDHPDRLLNAVQTLRQHGFSILMDDFGSGYSSLSMLKDLPVDILKVDMRFLTDMENNGRAANVMTSIIRMAKWLDITVVAEGVETQAQIEFLRSVGCDEVQGYYYAMPMPAEEFAALLRNPTAMRKTYNSDRERLLNDFDFQSLWESNQPISILFNGMIGAIGLYEKTGNTLEVLRVNESYFELMGSTPQSLLNKDQNRLEKLESSDRQKLLNACNRAAKTHGVEQAQICCPHADGHIMWLDIKVRHLGNVNKQELFYFALADITRQKELERNILLYQYGAAMLDTYNEVLELNYTDNIVTTFSFGGAGGYRTFTLPLDSLLRTMPQRRVHPEDQQRFSETLSRESLAQVFNNKETRTVMLELRTKREQEAYHWTRLSIHHMDDPTGKMRVLCCSRYIDEQKQNERIHAEYMALQAKQQEQERYRVILEQTHTALLAWSPDAQMADGNTLAQTYRLSGISYNALLTCNVPPDVADPQDIDTLRALLFNLKSNISASRLLRLTLNYGDTRWCKLCFTVQRDKAGQITAVLATINDVDHEHRIQLQLDAQRLQNERRLSMLSHLYWTLPCCILQLDLNDPPQPIFFNRACWEQFGFASKEAFDEVADRDLFALIAEEEREQFLCQLRRCRDERTVENIDITVVRPNGERGSLRGNAAVSHGSDGSPMLQLVLLDTTLQREQERRLENTTATLERTMDMLQHLLENLPVGVTLFEFGSLARALYINTRAYSMFGLKDHQPARFVELMRLSGFHLSFGDRDQPIQAINEQGVNMGSITRVMREDGSAFSLRTYYTIVPQTTTPPLCYMVLVDVTQQVEMERAYNRQGELYRIMMEDSHQIFFDYDLETDVMNYTLRMPEGNREELTLGNYIKSLKHSTIIYPEHIQSFINRIRRVCRTRQQGTHEFMANFYNMGEYRWYRAYFRCINDENGSLYRLIGRVVDIQDEKNSQAQLGQAKVFRRAVNSVSLFVFTFELPEMSLHLLSYEEQKRLGFYSYLDYLTAENNETLIHPDERAALMEALNPQNLMAMYRMDKRDANIPFRALNRQKNWIWLELSIHLSTGSGKNNISGIGYVKVIEDQKKLERKASIDGLTQLLNRTTAEERIERILCEGEEPCCLLILDVDDFKSVNDLFGHCAGDSLLQDLATVLRSHLRQSDIVGRLGGDEFMALMRNATATIARDKGAELLSAIETFKAMLPQAHPVSISIGYACAPQDGQTFAELYTAADKALYMAKRLGKNRCCSVHDRDLET